MMDDTAGAGVILVGGELRNKQGGEVGREEKEANRG